MATTKPARVTVGPLPTWLDAARLCGAVPVAERLDGQGAVYVELSLPHAQAATLAAQLRGLGFDGAPLEVSITPRLRREEVRAGRLAEARSRRDSTPGFSHGQAVAEGEGRFSLTPESLALALGARLCGRSVVDACAGSGGNSLGFARHGARVTAIELSAERRSELAHNARLYAVATQIDIVAGDALVEVPARKADVLFVDPPWGEHYDHLRSELTALPLLAGLLACDLRGYSEIWLKVPPSFVVSSLPGYRVEACFGTAPGDRQRVKFLLLVGSPSGQSQAPHCGPEVASPATRR